MTGCFLVASCRSLPAQEKQTLKISGTALRKEFKVAPCLIAKLKIPKKNSDTYMET